MSDPSAIPESDQKIVEDVVQKLLEHFDSVRIFVTRQNGTMEETGSFECGGGNFYAVLGQVREFIQIHDQYSRNWADRRDAEINP